MVRQSSNISMAVFNVESDLSATSTTDGVRIDLCILAKRNTLKKKKIIFIKIIKIPFFSLEHIFK